MCTNKYTVKTHHLNNVPDMHECTKTIDERDKIHHCKKKFIYYNKYIFFIKHVKTNLQNTSYRLEISFVLNAHWPEISVWGNWGGSTKTSLLVLSKQDCHSFIMTHNKRVMVMF